MLIQNKDFKPNYLLGGSFLSFLCFYISVFSEAFVAKMPFAGSMMIAPHPALVGDIGGLVAIEALLVSQLADFYG